MTVLLNLKLFPSLIFEIFLTAIQEERRGKETAAGEQHQGQVWGQHWQKVKNKQVYSIVDISI